MYICNCISSCRGCALQTVDTRPGVRLSVAPFPSQVDKRNSATWTRTTSAALHYDQVVTDIFVALRLRDDIVCMCTAAGRLAGVGTVVTARHGGWSSVQQ